MTTRRTATLVLSLLIGSVAALFAYLYVNSAQDRAFKGTELVRTLVVAGDIPKGMSGDEVLSKGLITQESVPVRYRPTTALPNSDAVRGKIAIANVPKGQVLVQGMFVDPIVAQETAAKRIPAGQVGVTVKIDDVTGVSGLITPGDKVNILSLEPGTDVEHTMYTNVDVLFVGKTPAPVAGSPDAVVAPESFLVTLAVPPLAAERIVWASHHEHGIHLTLAPPGSQPGKVPTVNNGNAWTGGATPNEG